MEGKSSDNGMQAQSSNEETQFCYGECPKVTELLRKSFYKEAMEKLPIFCVDIFLLNLKTNKYLVVFRKNRPAQGVFFLPGGRLYKGESFFEAAKRICSKEVGITIEPQKNLGISNLIFPDSEWGCPGHTPATTIFATCDIEEEFLSAVDSTQHTIYRWCSLFEPSNVDYTENARRRVLQLFNH